MKKIIILGLTVLFALVSCNKNEVVNSEQQPDRQKVVKKDADEYLLKVLLPLYEQLFEEDADVSEELNNALDYFYKTFDVYGQMEKSGYYKSFFDLEYEDLVERMNSDYPFFRYHLIKLDGTPLARKILDSVEPSESVLDSIIAASKKIRNIGIENIIFDTSILWVEKLYYVKLYVVFDGIENTGLAPEWLCKIIRFLARGVCLEVYGDTVVIIHQSIKDQYKKLTALKKAEEELDDCYKAADAEYEKCIK